MAVYKRTYKPYVGALTAEWSRFLVLPRYAFQDLFASKLLTGFVVTCFVPFIVEAALIYLLHNEAARALLRMQGNPPFSIDKVFFQTILGIQTGLAFLLAAWIGPGLVSPDLANNSLPLYLCRPFSRTEYVLGKSAVLVILLSLVTWVPVTILYGLQAQLEGNGWGWSHLRLEGATLLGSGIWIAVMCLLCLALSAWIKWRIAASAALFGIFFVGPGLGEAFNSVLRTYWGRLFNLSYLFSVVWRKLYDIEMIRPERVRRRTPEWLLVDIPLWAAWTVLLLVCGMSLWLLHKRLRAREVVR